MVCLIGDYYIEIVFLHTALERLLEAYRCDAYPRIDFSVTVTQSDIDFEFDAQKITDPQLRQKKQWIAMQEFNSVHRQISRQILSRGGFVMHGVLLECDGKGYLFTAKSGTGKTTHARLWQEAFGDRVRIINGDKPILRVTDGGIYGYGTPWCGKEHYNIPTSVKLDSILVIERAKENKLVKLSVDEALPLLLGQVEIANSADLGRQIEYLDLLLQAVPVYCMNCNMDVSAATVAYESLQKFAQQE